MSCNYVSCLFLVIILLFSYSNQLDVCTKIQNFIKNSSENMYFELVNSPVLLSIGKQQLRVIYAVNKLPGDKILIIQESPVNDTSVTIYEKEIHPNISSNYIDTDHINNYEMRYTALYVRANESVVMRSELGLWLGWMDCMKDYLKDKSLTRIFVPGTHDSGAYRHPSSVFPLPINDIIYTQDESIFEQLERGARYLDIRVGRYGRIPIIRNQIWWINHGIVKIRPLQLGIQEIIKFITKWPQEIIIVDFHEFPVGFKSLKDHDELSQYVIKGFGSHLYMPDSYRDAWNTTFKQIWSTQARIILSYNKEEVAKKYNFYSPVKQIWAGDNVIEKNKLFNYLNKNIPRNCSLDKMTSAMAALTPDIAGLVLYGGSRGLADRVNADISINYATGSWGKTAQAVAVDFLSSTGIVSAAIYQNSLRIQKNHTCN